MNVLRFAGVEFRSLLVVRTGVEMKGAGILIILASTQSRKEWRMIPDLAYVRSSSV